MRFILGITGGIGSGKSAATQWFESQGIRVIDADVVAREIVEPGQPALQKIQQLLLFYYSIRIMLLPWLLIQRMQK